MLVVDDEPNIRDLLTTVLRFHGFEVTTAGTAAAALEAARHERPEVMVLDVGLPDGDGFDVCRALRADAAPLGIVFLTARDDSRDAVSGLTLGGDDYVTKPFVVDELVARVRAVLRRVQAPGAEPEPVAHVLRVADLELDEDACQVRRAGRPVDLSPTEYRLLRHLLRNPRRVLSRAQILEAVWGYDFGSSSNSLDVYISYLRRKTEVGGAGRLVQTVRGVGYVLRER